MKPPATSSRTPSDSAPISLAERAPTQRATTLWLIRHAEGEERYQNVFGGRIDMALSKRGHEQAAALARYLKGKKFDALYASPMKRVQQTLASLVANPMPQPTVMSELREVDFGDWTGLAWHEVTARFGISAFDWLLKLEQDQIANAESGPSFRRRVEPAVREILGRHIGQQVAILCHGGVIRMMLAILLNWPLPTLAGLEIEYASITQVLWTAPRAKLLLANFTPWREAG